MNTVNYQKELDRMIENLTERGEVPTLLMHSCCAPCSSYCLSYLAEYFHITIYYYNPNIYPETEYQKRVKEQQRLIQELPVKYPITFLEGAYDPERFFAMAEGMEQIPEGGERCFHCYEMRQREAALAAKEGGFDYFTTTLSVSPHKNAQKLNEIGLRLQEEYGVKYLVSDFKKRGGYLKSIELSREYDLYRQNYCGCVYSKPAV
ncbi:MAG: epoxyqueuosine reductase QueH [Lachnospiraceae bacterium]|nr:epoxyqueuosine reductase QueH [Lachnospiraceae bacterium]